MIYQVALPVPSANTYDYLYADVMPPLQVGCRVKVSFGHRALIGLIVGHNKKSTVEQSKLKQIELVIDSEPVIDQHLLEFIHRAARYYHHPLGEAISTALPSILRQNKALDSTDETIWSALEIDGALQPLLQRAPKQQACFEMLQQHLHGLSEAQLSQQLKNWRPAMKGLKEKGLVSHVCEPYCEPPTTTKFTKPPVLNDEQQEAVANLQGLKSFSPSLLHGVTGSGKTEVYLAVIEPVLAAGKQCLVVVPEISLTPQLLSRFKRRFNTSVVALHSGLNSTERLQAWRQAQVGIARIIIGTRSAVFVPLKNPGMIIVDEEHDTSLKQQKGFRYHARDLAVMRAQMLDIPIVLGSATPSLETVQQVKRGSYTAFLLKKRAGQAKPPKFNIIDIRSSKLVDGFSALLVSEMGKTLDKDEQVLLFINRRGYAPAMLCHDCGAVIGCPRCSANMTWHARKRTLRCHHCDHTKPAPPACTECNSEELITAGLGTEQVEQTVKKLFPEAVTLRIDRDTMSKKHSLDQALAKIAEHKVQIIVGTQLLAKGHDFPGITLVAIMDVDQSFYSIDFRAAEKMSQQVLQVGGRAGRGERPGQVFIQTHQPDHPLLHRLVEQDYSKLAGVMLEEREAIDYPPFAHLFLIRSAAVKEGDAQLFLQQVSDILLQGGSGSSGVMVMGPVPAPMERRAGRYRYQLLLHASERKNLHQILSQYLSQISKLKSARRTRWSIDVDPVELS